MRRKNAGHRSWAPRGGVVPGCHSGDIMSKEARSHVMSQIKSRNTSPERIICSGLRRAGLRFSRHLRSLPGSPDIVFSSARLAIFIDGDFWHGWRFPLWKHKLSDSWQLKIEKNRLRDRRNMKQLRFAGWKVIRIWEHQVEQCPQKCIDRILIAHAARITSESLSEPIEARH